MMTPKRPDYYDRYKTVVVYIGKDTARWAAWQAAADAAGMGLGAWLASLADQAVADLAAEPAQPADLEPAPDGSRVLVAAQRSTAP